MVRALLRSTAVAVALFVGATAASVAPASAAPERPDSPTGPAARTSPAGPETSAAAAPTVSRVNGRNRYAVSVAASRAAFATGTHPPVLYLVSGVSPWESLSVTPTAVRQEGGVLMTRPDGIPAVVAAELERLAPASIVVVGGAGTLSDTVLRQAHGYAPEVRRVSGVDRYGSARALVRQGFAPGVGGTAWLASGRTWTDAVVAGAAAASHRAPLLTVDGRAERLPMATTALIRDLGLTSVTIAGDARAVSPGIQAQLEGLLGASTVRRATGKDRYAVAASVDRLAHAEPAPGAAYLANGRDAATAVSGGFLAGTTGRPLYFTTPYCVPAAARPALTASSVSEVVLVGGERSIRSLVGGLQACRSIHTESSLWTLVNKSNPLEPETYRPSKLVVPAVRHANGARLRPDAAAAVARMFSAARKDGAGGLSVSSGYRSHETQESVYRRRVSTKGRVYADQWIAHPGHSEHQTGLALDIAPVGSSSCATHSCIGPTSQGKWLRANAWRFGFVVRYESTSSPVTGFNGEPWHVRFVGTPLSRAYHRGGWHTLEQFLGEPAAPRY